MDITGKWTFSEEFFCGKDEGTASFVQKKETFTGELLFTETIEDELPFSVRCQVAGKIIDKRVTMEVIEHKIVGGDMTVEYAAEKREGCINSQGQIVGSSEDEEGVSGVFVFNRINE